MKSSLNKVYIYKYTAVAVRPFEVIYEVQGATNHEWGKNVLIAPCTTVLRTTYSFIR